VENASTFAKVVRWQDLQESGGVQGIGVGMTRALLAFILAMLGGLISSLTAVSHTRLCRLISLAAGMLFGVTLFSIFPEAVSALPPVQFVVALVSGYSVFLLISRYVFHICPACAASHFDEAATRRFSEIAAVMIIALGLHSTMDGMALVLGADAEIRGRLGLTLLLAVCVHKIPEGLALCSLLLAAGFQRLTALAWTAAVESTTILGGAIGLWAVPRLSHFWLDIFLAHVGGGFVFLAVHAMVGELIKHSRIPVLVSFAVGVLSVGAVELVLHIL